MQITKRDIIQKLYDIADENNLKLGREVQRVIRSEIIPIEVIKLINKYDKEFLQIYNTYNSIYESRHRNPLYRNLKNKKLKLEELAVALSSLVTKILISCTKIDNETERKMFATAMNIDKINAALTDYALFNKTDQLIEISNQVRELLNILYED